MDIEKLALNKLIDLEKTVENLKQEQEQIQVKDIDSIKVKVDNN